MKTRETRSERAASSVEYGLLIAAVAMVLAIAVYALGGMTIGTFDHTCDEFDAQSTVSTTC